MIRLFVGSEMGDTIGFRLELSTTSFEAYELDSTLNCLVHTWMGNASFMQNLMSWSMPFWLGTRSSTTLHRMPGWKKGNCNRFADSIQETVDASKFSTHVGKFTKQPLRTTPLTGRDFKNQNHIFLWNFHILFLLIFRSWRFPKVKYLH